MRRKNNEREKYYKKVQSGLYEENIKKDFEKLGLKEEMNIMVHSSLSWIG